jgi:hypothetical protein
MSERFLFVHIMKTGGTSLVRPLRRNFEAGEFYPDHADIRDDGRLEQWELAYVLGLSEERKRTIRVFAGHFPFVIGELLGGGFTTLTVLRDPVDRTISMLWQLRRDPGGRREMATGSLEAIYDDPINFRLLLHNHQTKIFSLTAADEPDSFMDDIVVDGSRLALAKDNLATVDVIGLTDRYTEFVNELRSRFGWRLRTDLRANEAAAAAAEVPASLRRRIADDNAIDMEFYEYATELVRCRGAAP